MFPRRHGLQSRFRQPAALPQPGRHDRHRSLRAHRAALDHRPRDLGDDGAVPVREFARLSYEYRRSASATPISAGLLMTSGIPYDSDAGRGICGALTAIMTGVSYATSAGNGGRVGAFPDYERNAQHMLRVIRNHRRAAHGEATGYEGLSVSARAARRPQMCGRRTSSITQRPHGTARWSSREARLSQRPGDRYRAHRHDRSRHGLRHHRHRARLRAGEVQEAGGAATS